MGSRRLVPVSSLVHSLFMSRSGYSPLDFSVLDPHWGMIQDWRNAIDEIHARGMYMMLDFTVGTLSDLIGFQGCVFLHRRTTHVRLIQHLFRFLNMSAPFTLDEYQALWKIQKYMPWNFTEYTDFRVCILVTFCMRGFVDPFQDHQRA